MRVPCSTSNLGSGFDTVGLALDRYLEASFDPCDGDGLVLRREGTLAVLDEQDGPDLVARMFEAQLTAVGITPEGILRLTSTVPVARGLGSSSTAVLAGFDLARAVQDLPRDDEAAFAAALAHEGHGDNAAPCLYGGLRAVAHTPEGPIVMSLTLSEAVGFAYAAPASRLSTGTARDVLPKQVSHKTAALSLGRLAALIQGLAAGDPELIRVGMRDELHVPHRLSMIPSAPEAMSAAHDAGAWAVTISGAGSGLIAMCPPDRADEVGRAMREAFDGGIDDPECVGFGLRPDFEGLQRLPS